MKPGKTGKAKTTDSQRINPMFKKAKENAILLSIVITMVIASVSMIFMAEASYGIYYRKVEKTGGEYYRLATRENSLLVARWYSRQVSALDNQVFALEQSGVEDRARVKQYLVDYLQQSDEDTVYDVYFMYPDNVMLCGTDFDNTVDMPDMNYNEREWYVNAVASDRAVVSTAYMDTDTLRPVITISKRVMIDGKIAGTLCVDMFIETLGDMINGESIPENSYGALVDSDFQAVFHPAEAFRYTRTPPAIDGCGVANYDLLRKALEEDKEEISLRDYDGTERTFYIQELSDTGWHVVTAVDSALLTKEAENLRTNLLRAALIILLIALVAEIVLRSVSMKNTLSAFRKSTPEQ